MQSCPDGSRIPVGQDCPKQNINLGLTAPRTELCPGETVTISPSAQTPEGATYQWTVNGQATASSRTLDFGTTGRQAGTYRIGLTTTAPGYNEVTAGTTITVREYRPPTGSLQVNPGEVFVGDPATLSVSVTPGQCGGTLRPTQVSATEGSVTQTGYDSSAVQFDPANPAEQRKTVRLVAQFADDKGQYRAEGSIVVKKRGAVAAKRLPDIIFPASSARVNNCGKRVLLEELKAITDTDATGKVILVGHSAANESGVSGLDQKRALNAAAVISAGQGICSNFPASQIAVSTVGSTDNGVDYQSYFCGTSTNAEVHERPGQSVKAEEEAKYRRVEVWFVPTGGANPASLKDSSDAASLSVANLGCPR